MSSSKQRIALYSPVPPAKTGTAVYLEELVREAKPLLEVHDAIIVCDRNLHDILPKRLHGFDVTDDASYISQNNDIVFCFIANNKFHNFVYRHLRRTKSQNIISVIHDLSVYMAVDQMICTGYDGMWCRDLSDYVEREVPRLRTSITGRMGERRLPEQLKYSLMCQTQVIEKSSLVITHSHHAAIRMLLEHRIDDKTLPIMVMRMPKIPIEATKVKKNNENAFTIGVFGWISYSKRPAEIVSAFGRFLNYLKIEERAFVKLKFVGEVADSRLDPETLAEEYGIRSFVECTGYVSIEKFRAEQCDCDVFLNLRFPSCGELSGTLNEFARLERPFAVSHYQSFKEEEATCHISIDPKTEIDDICRFLVDVYERWKARAHTPRQTSRFPRLPPKLDPSEAMRLAVNFMTSNIENGVRGDA